MKTLLEDFQMLDKKTLRYEKLFSENYKKLPKKLKKILDNRISFHNGIKNSEFRNTSQKALPKSWRPWSIFEVLLTGVTHDGLQLQLDKLLIEWKASGLVKNLLSGILWNKLDEVLIDKIESEFIAIAEFGINYAKELVEDSIVGINWDLVNKNVGLWASQHAAEQVAKINDVTREALRKTIAEWSKEGEGQSELVERIINLKDAAGNLCFDEQRAERIATTEATTIFAEANSAAWAKLGYPKAVFKPIAHIKCRCYLQPLKEGDTKSVVWYTAHDERVCRKLIDTETRLGKVKGCRELHGMIVGSTDATLLGTHNFHFGKLEDEEDVKAEKGGKGSGNFGHSGRIGKVGGSAENNISLRNKLKYQKIINKVPKGRNKYIGELEDGTKVLMKTTSYNEPSAVKNEVAAKKTADLFGIETPDVVALDNEVSVQILLDGETVGDTMYRHREYNKDGIEKIMIFDAIIGNNDRHSDNIIIVNNKLIPIDNDHAFPTTTRNALYYMENTATENYAYDVLENITSENFQFVADFINDEQKMRSFEEIVKDSYYNKKHGVLAWEGTVKRMNELAEFGIQD